MIHRRMVLFTWGNSCLMLRALEDILYMMVMDFNIMGIALMGKQVVMVGLSIPMERCILGSSRKDHGMDMVMLSLKTEKSMKDSMKEV